MVDDDRTPPPTPEPATPEGEPERYGPLELQRYVKDDGRSLILYAEVEE